MRAQFNQAAMTECTFGIDDEQEVFPISQVLNVAPAESCRLENSPLTDAGRGDKASGPGFGAECAR